MVTVPVATPVANPDAGSMVAIVGSLLTHVPPEVASVNVVVAVTHMLLAPLIAAGTGSSVTVTAVIAEHPNAEAVTVYTFAPNAVGVIVVVLHVVQERSVPAEIPVHV